MGILQRFLGKKTGSEQEEAVLVHLCGSSLSDEFWALQEKLAAVIESRGLGEFDGNEIGEETATLYAYGPDAQKLYAAVEPVLRDSESCRNARVVIRRGGPGSPQSEVQL